MELSQEFIESHSLTTEQVEAITKHYDSEVIPSIKKEYDGLANKNAEAILDGASKSILTKFGIEDNREQGEKIADFLGRILDKPFESRKSELEKKSKELDEKLKNFKGDSETKAQLEKLAQDNDELLRQVAELENLKGYDEKYQTAQSELSKLKLEVAFNGIKPNFPDTANKYEVDAKWNEFKNSVLEKYNIELVDGKPVAVDKENHHKQVKLTDLLEGDENITELLNGRQQKGTGSQAKSFKDVEGIPFRVPENATSEELSALVREHLVKKLGNTLHKDYASQFQELLTKIKKAA